MLLPTDLANSLQPVKGRTDGSRFAPAFAWFAPEGCSSSWRITGHREAIALSWAMGWIPHLTIMMISPDGALENTYVSFSQMKLWRTPMWCSPWWSFGEHLCGVLLESREASSFVAVGTLQLLLSLLAQMKLLQLRLPVLHAQVLHHSQSFVIQLSMGLVRRGISDSLPRTFSSTGHFQRSLSWPWHLWRSLT